MSVDVFRGRLLSKGFCAEHLQTSLSFIDRKIRLGDIKAVRISPKMTRIDGDSLADFLEQQAAIASTPRGKFRKVA